MSNLNRFNVSSMFNIPYLHLEIDCWDVKKEKINQIMKSHEIEKFGEVLTSYYKVINKQITSDVNLISQIFKDELNHMKQCFNFNSYLVKEFWFQEQNKDMFHGVHDHGSGISAICYIEYDSETHTATEFISPFLDPFKFTHSNFVPFVKSGDMIFFPSNLLHFTSPNKSKKSRRIMSMNIEVK